MSETAPLPDGDDPGVWIGWTTRQQALASDPARSAWVSANAGSGKTHVLTQRVIRLLLAGSRPSSILCLTYTKAAASEMSNRVFQRLAEWATLPDDQLAARIETIEGAVPDHIKLAEARRLFARALETPGGLKIQTIHAFCEALLHQFPLEANVAGHFSVLDDRAAATLLADARRSLLTATSTENDAELADAFAHVLDLADEFGLETLLGDIVANRNAIRHFIDAAGQSGGVEHVLRHRFDLDADENEAAVLAALWPLPGLSGITLDTYLTLAAEKGGSTVQDVADRLRRVAQEENGARRMELLEAAFLTQKGEAKSDRSLIAAAMKKAAPELENAINIARTHVVATRDRLRLVRMFTATQAALTLAHRFNQDYDALKKVRSQLDFEDLIDRAATLLTRSGVGPWVHYKLDQGIDHILVDEAQDTSPVQWTVIQSLAEDFFSGAGARMTGRTLFAVGDEKQSIYSFQGARPERFSQESEETARRVRASDQSFSSVRLPLSFRSTQDVLAAVDQVFTLEENMRGLSARGEPVVHRSSRIGHPGAVDLWAMIAPERTEAEEDWTAPFDSTPESAPAAILARRIAFAIEEMIETGTVIEHGVERRIQAGDILVLVRKRDNFVNALTRALKRRNNIPVAGADRLRLTSHIAIQDLLALGRFLLLPADDLSLTAVLKSPLFNLSEETIFTLCARRDDGSSVWAQLQRLAQDDAALQATCERLMLFQRLSHDLSVHDLYARILGLHGGRRQFLARLGSEASDILDEFLTFALDHEKAGLPGLQSFVSTLELEAPEVKREQDKGRNEVRIMTVHAAKGLEAPVVFLVDGGSKSFNHSHLPKFRMIGGDHELPVPVWVPVKGLSNSLTEADTARIQAQAEEEYRRLLYVGLTRAADRLIVCGYRGIRENSGTWHQMVEAALSADTQHCKPHTFSGPDGDWEGYQFRVPRVPVQIDRQSLSAAEETREALPEALARPLPPLRYLPRPLSPSGAGLILDDEADDLLVPSALFSEKKASDRSLQRGRLTHRMLQSLPDIPVAGRAAAAERYLARAAGHWPPAERQALARAVLDVLDHPGLEAVFSPMSRAEVSVMGTLRLNGQDYAVSGRIDRMAADEARIILVDFKTNRVPPRDADAVSLAHKAQIAIYREILRPLYPGRRFECVLVYTETAALIALSGEQLDDSLAAIKTK